ncbi:Fc.00g065200.m01.CDS01 [Cosmosporella sp. VM-42]
MVSVQGNMQMHDELAALFQRNLTFNPQPPAPIPQEEPRSEPVASASASAPPPIIYTSVHYTHSAHIARAQAQQQAAAQEEVQRPSSEPPQTEMINSETILRNHGVDPSTLTPSQVQLFRIADPPQQMRLLELWTICPPSKAGDIPSLAWSSTTLEQEEHLARVRYERSNQNQVMSLDGTTVQTGDGKWTQDIEPDSEPYMASGYEELMRREYERQAQQDQPRDTYNHFGISQNYSQATDPVYMGPDYARQQQQMDMATQYGAFQGFRGGEADAMEIM